MGKRRLKKVVSNAEQRQARLRWTTWAWLVGAVVVITGVIGFVFFHGGDGTATGTTGVARVGSPAPDFTLKLLTGQTLTLASLKGKPVLVNFWASACPHCRHEAPVMVRMYERYRDQGVAFVSVSVTWDKETGAERFVEEYHLPYPVGFDASGAIGGAYGVDATPTTFYVDRKGIIQARQDGAGSEAEITQRIDRLLAG